MWSFSRPPPDNSNTNQGFANVNHRGDQVDSARIALRKFSGYPMEDPERFLSDFEAYCKISRIKQYGWTESGSISVTPTGPCQHMV